MANGEDETREERWGIVTKVILPAVTAARPFVGLTEAVFRMHTSHSLPREFFLWTALDEITKTAVFLMKLDDILDAEPGRASPEEAEPVGRAVEAVVPGRGTATSTETLRAACADRSVRSEGRPGPLPALPATRGARGRGWLQRRP
jgi:hypothetical protein